MSRAAYAYIYGSIKAFAKSYLDGVEFFDWLYIYVKTMLLSYLEDEEVILQARDSINLVTKSIWMQWIPGKKVYTGLTCFLFFSGWEVLSLVLTGCCVIVSGLRVHSIYGM
jgi:hypothetical protein